MAKDDNGRSQARAQYESILEMVKGLRGDADAEWGSDAARQAIEEDALSVEVRTDWHSPGADTDKPTEYRILLCTGGPAVQIVGRLSQYGEPETATLQFQDWFTPWTGYYDTDMEEDVLLDYARCFWFGE
jgi:hypothetical protein